MKPIVIVRYFLGTGGRFLCTLLSSLIEPTELIESHRAHLNTDHDRYHSFNQKDSPIDQYDQHTSLYPSTAQLQKSTEFFRDAVRFGTQFNGMPEPEMFILCCHAYNPEAMLQAWPSSRVINIAFTEQDMDQISYNWITKNIIQESRPDDLRTLVKVLNTQWPRHMQPVTVDDIDWADVRNMTFITRWLNNQTSKRFNSISTSMASQNNVLNVKFSDIHSGKIITQLDHIIEFCGITISSARRENAMRLIRQYSSAQTPVPWSLDSNIRLSI